MKTFLFFLAVLFLFGSVFAENQDVKPRVTVTLVDGTSKDYKLDWIDENKIVVFERSTLDAVTFKRKDVASLSFGEDKSSRFKPGEEGFVLSDGTVIKGHPTSMDIDTYWIIPEGKSKEEKIDRDKVIFIQFKKPSGNDHGGTKGVSTSLVLVPANQWEDTGVDVVEGQKIWFTVSSLETYSCGPDAPRVNADGKEPFVRDNRRPIPDVKQCALIAKIGKSGVPFRVGLNQTPFTADRRGRLYIGVNDDDFSDNIGRLQVYIKTSDMY